MIEIRHSGITNTLSTQIVYDQIYGSVGISHRDSLYLWIMGLVQPRHDSLWVDISCGEGRMVSLAHERGYQVIGMDYSLTAIRKGQRDKLKSPFVVADGENLPLPDASVDYVTHIGSLEHYLSPEQGVCEIARILRSGGKAIILLPNAFGLLGNISYVLSHGDVFDDGQPLQRYATRKCWETLLQRRGLRVERTIGYGEVEFPRAWKDALAMLRHARKAVRALLSPLIPINLSNQFVFICSRDQSIRP